MLVPIWRATPLEVATALSVTWQVRGEPAFTDWGVQAIVSGLKLTRDTAVCTGEFWIVAVMVAVSS